MTVTVRAKLPKGDTNGLAHLEGALAANPDDVLVIVGFVRADTIEARPHDENDPRCVKTVLLHLEAINGADRSTVEAMLRSVYEQRTGKKALPFEDGEDDEDAPSDED